MMRNADFDIGLIIEPKKYEKRVQRVSATDMFGASDVTNYSFVQVCGGEKEENGLGIAKVLLLFKIDVRGCNESQA